MLVPLDFNLAEMNQNDHGVTYSVCKDNYEGRVVDLYLGQVDNTHKFWKDCEKDEIVWGCAKIDDGVYVSNDFNFDHTIDDHSNYVVDEGYYGSMEKDGSPLYLSYTEENDELRWKKLSNSIQTYGVADSIDQVLNHYSEAVNSSNPIVIVIVELRKKDQSPEGGWRWHKWGEYIGTQKPQMEYLYDEPEIEKVVVFHIYPVRLKNDL